MVPSSWLETLFLIEHIAKTQLEAVGGAGHEVLFWSGKIYALFPYLYYTHFRVYRLLHIFICSYSTHHILIFCTLLHTTTTILPPATPTLGIYGVGGYGLKYGKDILVVWEKF